MNMKRMMPREAGSNAVLDSLRTAAPLNDKIRRKRASFTIDEIIKIRIMVMNLRPQGFTDWKIATMIASRLEEKPKSIYSLIETMIKNGDLPENPKKQRKQRTDPKEDRALRDELAEKGWCDGKIARHIAKKTGRTVGSVRTGISAAVRDGKLAANPNNQETCEAPETQWVLKRTKQLRSIGLTDTAAARIIAAESDKRNVDAIRRMQWELRQIGLLPENEIRGKKPGELEEIILRRMEGIAEGKDDKEIAQGIAEDMERRPETIMLLIYRAEKLGGCRANPNNGSH
jgi:hypothetical protein